MINEQNHGVSAKWIYLLLYLIAHRNLTFDFHYSIWFPCE